MFFESCIISKHKTQNEKEEKLKKIKRQNPGTMYPGDRSGIDEQK
jgi:hypothetical protein